jgi:hypothetical protein
MAHLAIEVPENLKLKLLGNVWGTLQDLLPLAFPYEVPGADTRCFSNKHSFLVECGIMGPDHVPVFEPQLELPLAVDLIAHVNVSMDEKVYLLDIIQLYEYNFLIKAVPWL